MSGNSKNAKIKMTEILLKMFDKHWVRKNYLGEKILKMHKITYPEHKMPERIFSFQRPGQCQD